MPLSPLLKTSCSLFSGSGNIFCVTLLSPDILPIKRICADHQLDGLISYSSSFMRIFNADGSEASMCGNGLRCLIAFLWNLGDRRASYEIDTPAGRHQGYYLSDGGVSILFPPPSQIIVKNINGWDFRCLDTGVPHAVREAHPDWLIEYGPDLVSDPSFSPLGSNITCYWLDQKKQLHSATFERGLNRISGACGTGCLASAYVYRQDAMVNIPSYSIRVPSGESVEVSLFPPSLTGRVQKKEGFSILDYL